MIGEEIKPTKEEYESLARLYQIGATGDDDGWDQIVFDESNSGVSDTPLEEYDGTEWLIAAGNQYLECPAWGHEGTYWHKVQFNEHCIPVSMVIIDCGSYTLFYIDAK